MANRFWVGNSGNWTDTAHWSATSGGAGGASVPTSSDAVFFNASSFTTTGQTVTLAANQKVSSVDWTGSLHTPTLAAPSGGGIISNAGDVTLISAMALSGYPDLFVSPSSGTVTVTMAGNHFISAYLNTSPSSTATVLLADDFSANAIYMQYGTVDTAGHNVTALGPGAIYVGNSIPTASSVYLRTSTVSCAYFLTQTAPLTLSAASSVINVYTALSTGSASFTFGTVNLVGTGPTSLNGANTYGTVNFAGSGAVTIYASNTFGTMANSVSPLTIYFSPTTTQTVTNFNVSGTAGNLVTLRQSGASGTWTISKPSGVVIADYLAIQNSIATGGATWNTTNSTDAGGNTGWNFGSPATVTPTGIGTASAVGTMDAITGDALATPAGVENASATGTVTWTMDATFTTCGVEAVSSVGTPSVFADSAEIVVGGVATASVVGASTLTGDASSSPDGLVAVSYNGVVTVLVVSSPTVLATGVAMTSSIGTVFVDFNAFVDKYRGPRCGWTWWGAR